MGGMAIRNLFEFSPIRDGDGGVVVLTCSIGALM